MTAADQIIPNRIARRSKGENRHARWRAVADDFDGDVWPDLRPSFRIRPGQTVFTIGSCFARNIEEHLVSLGCHVPMAGLELPPSEWNGATNGAMNKFHPPAFRQCLEWTAAIHDRDGRVNWSDCEPLAFPCGEDRVFDVDMGAPGPVSRARFLERRQQIFDVFRQVFTADCLMMTPGLIEAWRDRQTGLYIHEAPTQKAMTSVRDRWELEILTYEACLADMLAAIDIVRARNPGIKVLVTTSPVPMSATFSGEDIRIANTYSKSVLRAVCGAVAYLRPLTDYFPSYESVTLSYPAEVWASDRIHVSQGFVGKIVGHMLDHYLEGVEEASRAHQRASTLLSSGDPAQAEQSARAALAARPDHGDTRVLLVETLLRQRRYAEAEAELKELLVAHPPRPDLWIMLARTVAGADAGRAAEAVAHVETAAGLPGVSLANFRSVAELMRRHASPEAAERLMRQAVESFPLHVEVYQPLVSVLTDQGRNDEAIDVLARAAALRRAPAGLHVHLAQLLVQAGRPQEARPVLASALSIDPANAQAAALLAALDGAGEACGLAAPEGAPATVAERLTVWSFLTRLRQSRQRPS